MQLEKTISASKTQRKTFKGQRVNIKKTLLLTMKVLNALSAFNVMSKVNNIILNQNDQVEKFLTPINNKCKFSIKF